jgi:MFS family permease
MDQLPLVYGITGVFSIATGPFIGKLSDKIGKFKVFVWGSIVAIIMVAIYTPLGVTPLWVLIAISVVMFTGVSSRMISSSALVSAIPAPQDRGAFMSVNASVQQISGGIASAIAGIIVVQRPDGLLDGYPLLGYVVIGSMIITIAMMYWIDQHVKAIIKRDVKPIVVPEAA